MYTLINTSPFNWNITLLTPVPNFPAHFAVEVDGTQGVAIPYFREKVLTITAEHTLNKNYYKTGVNICRAYSDVLDAHVPDAYKMAPATAPSTIGWNSTVLPNEIFEQLMTTYGKPTPNAMCQNNLTFLPPYNPKDPPKLLFKCCADCQEIAIVAKIHYTPERLLMNISNLFTHVGIYTRDMDNWECKPDNKKTYVTLRPFIQAAYQRHLASGVVAATQSGYASNNCFASITAIEDISDNGTTETIVKSINTHMANLSTSNLMQSTVLNDGNTAALHALMQQVAANKAQRNTKHNCMMQQFAMMTTTQSAVQQLARNFMGQTAAQPPAAPCTFAPHTIPILALAQQWSPPDCSNTRFCNSGRGRCNLRSAAPPGIPVQFSNGNQMIPYILAGIQPPAQPQNPCYSNVVNSLSAKSVLAGEKLIATYSIST
jgi:hypothetical protein